LLDSLDEIKIYQASFESSVQKTRKLKDQVDELADQAEQAEQAGRQESTKEVMVLSEGASSQYGKQFGASAKVMDQRELEAMEQELDRLISVMVVNNDALFKTLYIRQFRNLALYNKVQKVDVQIQLLTHQCVMDMLDPLAIAVNQQLLEWAVQWTHTASVDGGRMAERVTNLYARLKQQVYDRVLRPLSAELTLLQPPVPIEQLLRAQSPAYRQFQELEALSGKRMVSEQDQFMYITSYMDHLNRYFGLIAAPSGFDQSNVEAVRGVNLELGDADVYRWLMQLYLTARTRNLNAEEYAEADGSSVRRPRIRSTEFFSTGDSSRPRQAALPMQSSTTQIKSIK